MSISRIAMSLALALLLGQLTAVAADACESAGKTHKLKFKVQEDGCVLKVKKDDADEDADADTIHVCVGDDVRWKVSGPAKSIAFDGDSPFDWQDSGFKSDKIEGKIKPGTEGNPYKYSVMVDGLSCVLDPKIVVDR